MQVRVLLSALKLLLKLLFRIKRTNLFAKFIATISLVVLSFFLNYWIMVFGWGLTLISWKWFVFGTMAQGILVTSIQSIGNSIKDEN